MRLATLLAAACLAAATLPAHAGRLADLSVYDRTDGRYLPVYGRESRHYVIGEPGHEYELHVRGTGPGRVLAVTSVDGVNVLSGETASTSQTGYVVAPGEDTRIDGWRKNLDEVAAFYFTRLPDSYAARTGRPDNVGVIGVALFREKTVWPRPCCWPRPRPWESQREEDSPYGSRDDSAGGSYGPQASPKSPSAAGSAAAPPMAEDRAERRSAEKLGTGHGERMDSQARYVDFVRASDTPDETLTIWYDSRPNLVAMGLIPAPPRPVPPRYADPFPAHFVPDP